MFVKEYYDRIYILLDHTCKTKYKLKDWVSVMIAKIYYFNYSLLH